MGRAAVQRAVKRATAARRPPTFSYTGILSGRDVREAVAGIRAAGSPKWSLPLLAWLGSHPSTPEDVLRDLHAQGERLVLLSLAMNRNLPADLRKLLMAHADRELREHANHVFSRLKRH
jgi:hypothetical protein